VDYEKAQEIRSSGNWEEVIRELDSWIRAEELKLRGCIPEQLSNIQQTIAAYEKVKNLPTIVIEREEQ
jgi:hypothetical protein